MRARFTPPRTEDTVMLQGTDTLKEEREYIVLEIFTPYGRSALFRIEFAESEKPALFDSRAFTVTSTVLPPTWRYANYETGPFTLCPEPWSRPGFWESYYDHEPSALEVYESEKQRIITASQPTSAD
ncbi:hypothetical protein [Streptomyces malaysiensis]|uniref:hypothetical protein n=1 Tax=Streptomyces malaysiensis TaxID=92644 RepID=UPI00142E9D2F|nr:hypothetical protein [Streptomyces malaysiensis]